MKLVKPTDELAPQFLDMLRDYKSADPENHSAYEKIENDVEAHIKKLADYEVSHEDSSKPPYSTRWLQAGNKLVGEIPICRFWIDTTA